MTRRRPRELEGWATALAAVLLAAQAVLLAFSVGAGAAPVLRDRFGNVLCVSDSGGGHGAPSEPGDRHGGRLDCCTAGCPMLGGGLLPPETGTDLAAGRDVDLDPVFALHEDADASAVPPSPRRTRAPPLSA